MAKRREVLGCLLCASLISVPRLAGQTFTVSGVVRDSSGAVIVGAEVRLRSESFESSTRTDDQGRFSFSDTPIGSGTIGITAVGFTPVSQSWRSSSNRVLDLVIVLEPSSVNEQVAVSATRTEVRLSNTPGSTVLLSNLDVAATPALRVDDVLRQVPGFSLFRRSGSRVANASNQGVSLRGVGGTASSRALVLSDGISLVDPFGGWVYWNRVPRAAISTLEVFRGGSSNLYGSSALGGVAQMLTRQPDTPAVTLEGSLVTSVPPSFPCGREVGWAIGIIRSPRSCSALMVSS